MPLSGEMIKDDRYYGLYVGEVIDIDDPEDWGRLKVRIFEVYGTETETPDEAIPWAYEIERFGGTYDSGSRTPYMLRSTVGVIFERGNPIHPLVVGGIPKKPLPTWVYRGAYSSAVPTWTPPTDFTEIPKEARSDNTKFVVWKTPKGASIIVEEGDLEEYVRIIDRAGQVIEMKSPALKIGTGNPRGTANVVDSDGLAYAKVIPPATIRIIDLAGQEINMTAEPAKEKVKITSGARGATSATQQWLEFDSTTGKEVVTLIDSVGQYFKLTSYQKKVEFSCLGDHIATVTKSRTETIGTEHTKQVGTNMTYTAGANVNITSGANMTINATGVLTVQALATVLISALGAVVFNAAAAFTLAVTGVMSLLSTQVILGQAAEVQKVCNKTFMDLYNSHTHNYNPGPGGPTPSGVPNQIGVEDTHTTKHCQLS